VQFGDSGLPSFGGGHLMNGAPVRFAHIDEAGTSRDEANCVVAGVVSHPDRQWLSINQHLTKIADEFVPPEQREGVIFHAKDIWHGTKKFRRDVWPRPKRLELLHELAKVPCEFELPVIAGVAEKERLTWDVPKGSKNWLARNYSLAFGLCAIHFEYVLREMCEPHELGTIIAEDLPEMRQHAKWGCDRLRDPKAQWQEDDGVVNYMPMQRVIEQPLFAIKTESAILQIADLVAFVLGRVLNGNRDVQPLLDRFKSQIVILPHQRGD
jgi:hypothetical protein